MEAVSDGRMEECMSKSYQISSASFGWLGNAFPNKNRISPLTIFADQGADFNEETKKKLLEQEVISQDGTISAEVLPALRLLAEADGYTRIRILGTGAPVDKVTYFKQGLNCSVDSEGNTFLVTYPALTKEAGFVLEEFTGSSRYVNAPFQGVLTDTAAVVFVALIDLIRANSLCTLGGKPGEVLFTLTEILNKATEATGFLWLTEVVRTLVKDGNLNEKSAKQALAELESKQLIITQDGKYSLQYIAMELANSMLIPEYIFHITSARMISADKAEQSECYVIFCGMHSLLYLDRSEAGVNVESMSGSDLFMILSGALKAPLT